MVSLEWMTQLWVEYSVTGGNFGEGCGPLLNSCHGQWPLRVDSKCQQVGVLSASYFQVDPAEAHCFMGT
jgi:hypothetical protein